MFFKVLLYLLKTKLSSSLKYCIESCHKILHRHYVGTNSVSKKKKSILIYAISISQSVYERFAKNPFHGTILFGFFLEDHFDFENVTTLAEN